MKNKNISLCVIATALLMGKSVKATDFVIVKDNTVIVNQAVWQQHIKRTVRL